MPNTDLHVRDIPKALVDMLDAQSISRGSSRREVLLRLLRQEAKRWAHEHIVTARVMGGNSVMEELASLPGDEDGGAA